LSVEGASSFGACGNCGALLTDQFCSSCGEKKVSREDFRISTLAADVGADLAQLDTRILRTVRALLTKPGQLTKVYFQGGRTRFTKPLTLFVILNLVFFVIQPHTGLLRYKYANYVYPGNSGTPRHVALIRKKLASTRETETAYAIRFNSRLQEQKKSMLIFSIPMLALVMTVLYFRSGRYFTEHLIFSVHVYAFLLIALLLLVAVMMAAVMLAGLFLGDSAAHSADNIGDFGISIILGTGLWLYIYAALRRAYDDTRAGAALRAFVMTWTVLLLTGVYHDLLFYATFFTT
jgi:hypothetical protein